MRVGLPVLGRARVGHALRRARTRCTELGRAARVLGRTVELGFLISSKVMNVYSI